jgi:hypothetical protein
VRAPQLRRAPHASVSLSSKRRTTFEDPDMSAPRKDLRDGYPVRTSLTLAASLISCAAKLAGNGITGLAFDGVARPTVFQGGANDGR